MFARNDYVNSLKKIASELSDRAEEIVGENVDNISDFDIYIHFLQDGVPSYNIDKSYIVIPDGWK